MPQHTGFPPLAVLGATLAVALSACGQPQLPEAMFAVHAAEHCPSASNDDFYPAGLFESARFRASGERSAAWASRILASMSEPPLSCGPVVESYRFVWIHSFSNWQPTEVRINREGERWTVVAVRLMNAVNRKISERREKVLTDEESRQALSAFKRFGLWQKSSFAYNPDVEDGAMWIVEGRQGTAYHAVLRANVDEDALRELALTLFGVSGMNAGQIRRRGE